MAIIICSMAIIIAHDDHLAFAHYGHYYSLSIASMAIIMVILAIIICHYYGQNGHEHCHYGH